jgi:membrane protein
MGFIKDRFLSLTMVLGTGFLLLVSLMLSTALSAFGGALGGGGDGIIWQLVDQVASFVVITLLFAMIFKLLPDVEVAWRDVWIGAILTATLFTLGKFLLGFYLGREGAASGFGAAGSLVVILLWVYYSSQILLFGAEFTAVYAKKYGGGLKPAPNAIPLTDESRAQQGMKPSGRSKASPA